MSGRVVVLGSNSTDFTLQVERLPRAGETLLGSDLTTGPGGKGANQAVAARRAGADVTFLTAMGKDDRGDDLLRRYQAEGLDMSWARQITGVSTGTALIFLGTDGQNLIGVYPGANGHLSATFVDDLPDTVFRAGSVLLACLEIPLPTAIAGLRRAKAREMVTVLNPAPANLEMVTPEVLRLIDVLTPNEEEAALLAGSPAGDPERAARRLREGGARAVVVTLGGDGALLMTEEGTTHFAPYPVNVVDTVGAGDAFNGALAAFLSEGKSLTDATRAAGAAGALAVTAAGAQGGLGTRAQIEELLKRV